MKNFKSFLVLAKSISVAVICIALVMSGVALTLTLGACTPTQGTGVSTSFQNSDNFDKYFALTKPGNTFRGDTNAFDLNAIIVPNSTQAIEVLRKSGVPSIDGVYKGDWSENAVPLYNGVCNGTVPAFQGQTEATFLLNLNTTRLPQRLFYGKGVCGQRYMQILGFVEVRPSAIPGFSEVTVPVTDGGNPTLVVPRSSMTRAVTSREGHTTSVVPIVRLGSNVRALQLPQITSGTFQGWTNTLISKPSGEPGVSHAAQRARALNPNGRVKYLGVLYPFVVEMGGS